jgi:cyclophilin family peptidyl-prolyl cis-trans isomerase
MKRVKEDFEKVSMELSTQEDINHELLSKVHDLGDNFDMDSNVYQQHRELEEKYLKRIEELETGLAKKLSGMATIKYGNGPYHVVVHLSNEPLPGVGTSFMIETAPASIMPLSVGHFLRLVERELWNGLILLHRFEGSNVVHTAEISGDTMKLSPYNFDEDPQLRLPFIEKNDEYPLVKYSVGFEGNPGGPNFFILMDDFSTQHTVFGNTPFGKVIHGEKVLDAIVNMRGQSPDMFRIDSIFVLPTEETNGK